MIKPRLWLALFFAFLIFVNFQSEIEAQIDQTSLKTNDIQSEQTAVAKLRQFYAERDFESGAELGQKLAEQFPQSVELQSWTIVNMARNDMTAEAVKLAKKLVAANQENPWAQFALAHAYIRNLQIKESIPVVETALKLMPDDEEFIFLQASALLSQRKYHEIYALLDQNSSKIKDQTRLLYVKAEAEYRQFADEKNSDSIKKQSFELFAKALRKSPNSINASFIAGLYLYADKRFAEALPILKKAVSLAPQVVHIRQAYWRALLAGQPKKIAEQRNSEVIDNMNDLLRLRPDSIKAYDAVAAFYGRELQIPEKEAEIEQMIVKKFPQSPTAERFAIEKIKNFNYIGEDKKIDEKQKAELVQMLKNFLERPKHFDENYVLEANSQYFHLVETDQKISDADLVRLAEKISAQAINNSAQIHSMIVAGLSERQMFGEAERFVSLGFEKVKEEIERQRESVKDEKKNRNDLNTANAVLYAARGILFYQQKRFDEAENDLLQAVKLNNQTSNFYSELGEVYEAKNIPAKAEDAYINAYSISLSRNNQNNPNFDKIKALYQKRNGNLNNFEEYFEKIKVIERARRKERILAARIAEAESVTPFSLKTLDVKLISSVDLKGKVVVINIWGSWCAPCVREMPDFQLLAAKYRKDQDVVILTINNDDDVNKLRRFMADKNYDFTVLHDEKYLDSIGVNAFPTTWFIDRDGKISFIKVGGSDKLIEEFGWRIEELKNRH